MEPKIVKTIDNKLIIVTTGIILVISLIKFYLKTKGVITETGKLFLDGMSAIAQVLLVYIAYRALEQITVSKDDVNRRDNRDAINLALRQIEIYYMGHYFLKSKVLKKCNEKVQCFPKAVKFEDFNRSDVVDENNTIRRSSAEAYEKLIKAPVILENGDNSGEIILEIANNLEAFAIPFVRKVADDEIGFETVGRLFCDFVERYSFFYCLHRKDEGIKNYKNTIELYKRWVKIIEIRDLEHAESKIKSKIDELNVGHKNKN